MSNNCHQWKIRLPIAVSVVRKFNIFSIGYKVLTDYNTGLP